MFVSPDEEEIRHLVADFKLDEHTLASTLDPDELSRLEFEPEHVALIYKSPVAYSPIEPYMFRVASVGIYRFREKLVIVSRENMLTSDDLRYLKA